MHRATPLPPAKISRISRNWPVFRQVPADNQRKTKRVESCLVLCLDGGSSPPSSTESETVFGDNEKSMLEKNKVLALRYGNARLDEDIFPDDSCGKF